MSSLDLVLAGHMHVRDRIEPQENAGSAKQQWQVSSACSLAISSPLSGH